MSDISQLLDAVREMSNNFNSKLGNIELKLEKVIRMEERIESHDKTLFRHSNVLSEQSRSLQELQIYRAKTEGLSNSIEAGIRSNSSENDEIWRQVEAITKDLERVKRKVSNSDTADTVKEKAIQPYKDVITKVIIGVLIAVILASPYVNSNSKVVGISPREENKEIKYKVLKDDS